MNLEIKYHCSKFEPLREILREIGAKNDGIKEQKDYYFNLPGKNPLAKMKYRIERSTRTLVYYVRSDFTHDAGIPCDFKVCDDSFGIIFPILQEALGVNAVVKKKREQWRKGLAQFHLDDVQEIGKLFEIEYETRDLNGDEKKFQKLLALFLPHLGKMAKKSNGEALSS